MKTRLTLIDAVSWCYPASWRHRYAPEVTRLTDELRQDGATTTQQALDLLMAAPGAWIRAHHQGARSMESASTKEVVRPAGWGLLALIVAGTAFAKLAEDPQLMNPANPGTMARLSYAGLVTAGILAAVTTCLAAVPQVLALARSREHRGQLVRLAVVPLAGVVVLATIWLAKAVASGAALYSVRNIAAFTGLVLAALVCGVVVTSVVSDIAARVPSTPMVVRSRSVGVVILAVAAILAMISAAGWSIAVIAPHHALLTSRTGLLASPLWVSLVPALLMLVAAVSLAANSARRSVRVSRAGA